VVLVLQDGDISRVCWSNASRISGSDSSFSLTNRMDAIAAAYDYQHVCNRKYKSQRYDTEGLIEA